MSDAAPPLVATLRALGEMLGEYDVDWAVGGGVAANVYRAVARTTFDVDLMVSVDHASIAATTGSASQGATATLVSRVQPLTIGIHAPRIRACAIARRPTDTPTPRHA